MRETEILADQQPPQGVAVRDHASLILNKFSHIMDVVVRNPDELQGTRNKSRVPTTTEDMQLLCLGGTREIRSERARKRAKRARGWKREKEGGKEREAAGVCVCERERERTARAEETVEVLRRDRVESAVCHDCDVAPALQGTV